MKNSSQPWILNWVVDTTFILAPSFLAFFCVVAFPSFFEKYSEEIPPMAWLFLILVVDVSHVYATLFRTYFDVDSFNANKSLFILVPLFCFTLSVLLFSVNPIYFWRIMAYLAVFHFIRQQYGFLKIYIRKEQANNWMNKMDVFTIYAITFIPILIWHCKGQGNFNWFVEGDFLYMNLPQLVVVLKWLFVCISVGYVGKEIVSIFTFKRFNLPKNALMLGTGLSWYFGIVINEGDLAFTALNVVSHGIPYMALVHIFCNTKHQTTYSFTWLKASATKGLIGVTVFLGILIGLGYVEELVWDVFVWQDHVVFFDWAYFFNFKPSPVLLTILVPLLSLPQLTHYILDGFIWRLNSGDKLKL